MLSLVSLNNCTCGARSDPNAAVAIRQPLFGCDVVSKETITASKLDRSASKFFSWLAYVMV